MDQVTDTKVLIIGGGPAGLTLAQILQANNVSCTVFERDSQIDARAQGWAVALTESLDRIRTFLPPTLGDIYSTSVNAATGAIDTGVVLEASSGAKVGQIGGPPKWQPGSMLRVRRERLRHFLQKDLDVEFGKQLEYYREDEHGVTAFFKDGSRARGSILVGADGASSNVRSQLLNKQAQGAPYLPIVGICRFSRQELQKLQSVASALFIACADDLRFLTGLLETEPDNSAALAYWAVCTKSSNPDKDAEWMQTASKEELFEMAVGLTANLDQSLTFAIHKTGPEGVMTPPLRFREFSISENLPAGRVTLMGDAVHTMMPFRGAGANTALLDACDLASLIIEAEKRDNGYNVVSVLQEYSSIACPRGAAAVAATQASGDDMHKVLAIDKQLHKPEQLEAGQCGLGQGVRPGVSMISKALKILFVALRKLLALRVWSTHAI